MEKEPFIPKSNNSKNIIGGIIILIGILFLLKNLNIDYLFPSWMFGWYMILIIVGLVIGINSQFQKKSSIILIALGLAFLAREIMHTDFGGIIFPILIIGVGAYFIIGRKKGLPEIPPMPNNPNNPPKQPSDFDWDKRVVDPNTENNSLIVDNNITNETTISNEPTSQGLPNEQTFGAQNYANTDNSFEDVLNVNSIFASLKKLILSKNFRGGNIACMFGSVSIDLTQADITDTAVIDAFQMFGSAKIIVPANWTIYTNVSSVFGDVDDRRFHVGLTRDPNKKLYITGTCLFGNLTIRNV
ncbi:cell wall-active antibiotics response protein [Sphingobacterium sp. SRCM116780]|uniref:LiaF transmembrane domain-containing protein n=1 Tax=Sphingobacterium sp. SRCM116780 TaxID=2907623 RepID=UPI001F180EA7|nr:LiaF domain-containing protein [Sphingobacterium sp. SRCM116780]UIR57918.1 cell wall-active antibiotics response protein [Sphingobacterium sp. SRCM116780]